MGAAEVPGEEAQIRRAIFSLLEECPVLPPEIARKYGETGTNSVAVMSIQGEQRRRKQFISGAYEAQLPFSLQYTAALDTDSGRINAEELLQNTADWMCGKEVVQGGNAYKLESYPALSEGRVIAKIEAGSVFQEKKPEDGIFAYQVTMNLLYTQKGNK